MEGDVDLLTDQNRLEERFRYAREYDDTRPGLAPQRPISVLEAIATYVSHAVSGDPSKTTRPIPKFNKRFMLSFGEDCDELLKRLGFTAAHSDNQEAWNLPQPPDADPFDSSSQKAYLLDVREELLSYIRRFPGSERQILRWISSGDLAVSADGSLDRVLGASTYDKAYSKRSQLESIDDPLYAGLGALSDFSDQLVLHAFNWQTAFDQQQSPYYYDCLSAIAERRNSEALSVEIATMASQGFITRKDVEDAYRYFTIDPQRAPNMEDGHILGLFQSRLESAPAHQENDIRQQLRIIGQARGSNMLTDAASNSKCICFRTPYPLPLVERVPLSCLFIVLPLAQLVNIRPCNHWETSTSKGFEEGQSKANEYAKTITGRFRGPVTSSQPFVAATSTEASTRLTAINA